MTKPTKPSAKQPTKKRGAKQRSAEESHIAVLEERLKTTARDAEEAKKMRLLAEDAARAFRMTVGNTRIGLLHSLSVIEGALVRRPMTGRFGKPAQGDDV